MQFNLKLSITSILLSLTVQSSVCLASTRNVYNIAKSVTVKIETMDGLIRNQGSGILVNKKENVYFLVTNQHVVHCPGRNCIVTITTPDAQQYIVGMGKVETTEDLDLAVFSFSSPKNYQIAKLAKSNILQVGDLVYTAGFPAEAKDFRIAGGEIMANAKRRLVGDSGGYTLIYNAHSNSGMSGGGVFNQQGQVVAIHGQGDRIAKGTTWMKENSRVSDVLRREIVDGKDIGRKSGFGRGIPTEWLLYSALAQNIDSSVVSMAAQKTSPQTADDYFILGINLAYYPDEKDIEASKTQALKFFDTALELNPNYSYAYTFRAVLKGQLGDMEGAQSDLMKSNQPNGFATYGSEYIPENQVDHWLTNKTNKIQASKLLSQAVVKMPTRQQHRTHSYKKDPKVENHQETLELLDQAIQLFPKDSSDYLTQYGLSTAYQLRSQLRKEYLGDATGAEVDLKLAAKSYPMEGSASSYLNRGNLKEYALNDRQAAAEDYAMAAKLSPKEKDDAHKMATARLKESSSIQKQGRDITPSFLKRKKEKNILVEMVVSSMRPSHQYSKEASQSMQSALYAYSVSKDIKLALSHLYKAANFHKQAGNEIEYQQVMNAIRQLEHELEKP
jgi:tetratricopeptide (TPR) repeat protein